MPYPDLFNILGGVPIAAMSLPTAQTNHCPDLQIELAPTVTTARTNLTGRLPAVDDDYLSRIFQGFGLAELTA